MKAQHLGREVSEELAGAINLTLALGKRFAFLACDHTADLIGAGHQLRPDGHQHVVALLDTGRPPDRLGLSCGGHGLIQLRAACLAVCTDHIRQVRRVPVLDG